jgi:quinol monooxygenase YgiN
MYMRVWEYKVEAGQVDDFIAAYGPAGASARLFARAEGYGGTELFRDVDKAGRFLTVDRWADAARWDAFLARWGPPTVSSIADWTGSQRAARRSSKGQLGALPYRRGQPL